jgi:hypothetical protein
MRLVAGVVTALYASFHLGFIITAFLTHGGSTEVTLHFHYRILRLNCRHLFNFCKNFFHHI